MIKTQIKIKFRCPNGPLVTPKPKFAYPPNLVSSTAARRQVAAASAALAELGIDDVAVCRSGQAAGGGLAAG